MESAGGKESVAEGQKIVASVALPAEGWRDGGGGAFQVGPGASEV